MGAGFGLTAFADTPELLVITVLTWTLGEMIMMPAAFAYPGRFAPAQLRGRYQGSFGLAQGISTGAGPVIGGYLFSRSHALNWAVCGIVGIVGMAFMVTGTRVRASRPADALRKGMGSASS